MLYERLKRLHSSSNDSELSNALPFSRLSIFFVALILIGFVILLLDYPDGFDVSNAALAPRTLSIGYSDDIAKSIKVHQILTWYTVQSEGKARVHIEFIFQNIGKEELSSSVIFILPQGSEIIFVNSEDAKYQNGTLSSIKGAEVIDVPFQIRPNIVRTINLEYGWDNFAQHSRFNQWEYYVVGRPSHPNYAEKFYQLRYESNSTMDIQNEVNVASTGYRIEEYHPSNAIDYPVLIDWRFNYSDFEFTLNGTYANERAREYLEPLKQSHSIYLSVVL